MRTIALSLGLLVLLCSAQAQDEAASPRFTAVNVYIDAQASPLAAWQVELTDGHGVQIVGVEGGEHAAYAKPPYYDPNAMKDNRIILAAFSTAKDLPAGKTRVARIHVMVEGGAEPKFEVRSSLAAAADGKEVEATVTLEEERGN